MSIAEWGKKSSLTQSNYFRQLCISFPYSERSHQVSITVYVAEDKADVIKSREGRDYLQLESSGGSKVRTAPREAGAKCPV